MLLGVFFKLTMSFLICVVFTSFVGIMTIGNAKIQSYCTKASMFFGVCSVVSLIGMIWNAP